MTDRFQKRTSSILATTLIGIIIIAFAFGGVDSFVQQPDSVGVVGKYNIPIREYERTFQQQLDYYKQLFGGKDLTSKQIEQFNLKQSTFDNLVNKRLMYVLADNMGVSPSSAQVKTTIKELPYFQNEQKVFDIQRYKSLLQANQFTPQVFEAEITNDLKLDNIMPLISNIQISPNLVTGISSLKQKGFALAGVQIAKKDLEKSIDVPQNKVAEYLSNPENNTRVENLFKSRKDTLNQVEQVLANHILIKAEAGKEEIALQKIQAIAKQVNSNNFKKLAEQFTEDPSGKKSGGTLGWFGRGRMVPEFENIAFTLKAGQISQPVKTNFGYHLIYVEDKKAAKEAKLEDYKNTIAIEMIQKDDKDGLKNLSTSLAGQIEQALVTNNVKAIEQLKTKYNITYESNGRLNRIDGSVGRLTLSDSNIATIFKENKNKKIFTFDEPLYLFIVKVDEKAEATPIDETKEKELLAQNSLQKLQTDLISALKNSTKVKSFNKQL